MAPLRLPELPFDRRAQPQHVLFGDVILRPGPHHRDRGVLTDLARDDDERRVVAQPLQQLEGGERPETRHVIVGDDYLPRLPPRARLPERPLHLLGGADQLVEGLVAAAAELAQKEQRVVLRVLDQEHAQRGARLPHQTSAFLGEPPWRPPSVK